MAATSVRAVPLGDKDNLDDEFEEGNARTIIDALEMEESIAGEFAASDADVVFQLRVHELPGTSKTVRGVREIYLFTVDQSQYETINDKLRDDYGSGLYRVRLWARQGNTSKKLRRQYDIEIRAPEKRIEAPAPTQNTDMAAVMRMMEESQRRQQEFIERMLDDKRGGGKEVDPLDMMEKMSSIMANMGTARGAPAAAINDPTELVLKGVELAERLAKAPADSGGVADLVREIFKSPLTEAIVKNVMAARPPVPPAAPTGLHQVAPAQVQAPAAQSPTTAPESPPWPPSPMSPQEILSGQIAFLLVKAKQNLDPEIFANFFFVELPPEHIAYLCDTPGILNQAIALVPEVVAHRDWFEEFIAIMKENVAEAAEADRQAGSEQVDATKRQADSSGNDR